MGMKGRLSHGIRPALRGFFVCVALAGVLAVVRLFIPSIVTYRWDSERIQWRKDAEQIIYDTFQKRIERLTYIAKRAATDTSLIEHTNLDDVPAALQAFVL